MADIEGIFDKQKKFQKLVGGKVKTQKFRNEMLYALIAEVVEAGNETAWKSWKHNQKIDKKKFIEELADIQIFLINLVLSTDCEPNEFFSGYVNEKIDKNFKRQKNGY